MSLLLPSAAFSAGVIDAGADMVKGFKDLFVLYAMFQGVADCWLKPLTVTFYTDNCSQVRQQSKEMAKKLGDLIFESDVLITKSAEATKQLGNDFTTWLGQVSCSGVVKQLYDSGTDVVPKEFYADLKCCQYTQGRLVFDLASMLYGVGGVNGAVKLGAKLSSVLTVAQKIPALMSRMSLPKIFSLKPVKTAMLALGLFLAPAEAQAFKVAEVRVLNSVEQLVFSTAEKVGESGGRVVTRATPALVGIELVEGGGEKLAEAAAKKFINETVEEVVISTEVNGALVALLAINKVTGIVQKLDSDCSLCKEKQPSTLLCEKLKRLQVKGGSKGTQGVTKLCANLENARLETMVNKLLGLTDEETVAFLGDIIDSQTNQQCIGNENATLDLSNRVAELTVNLVDGWLIYKRGDRSCFRLDMSKLKKAGQVWEICSARQFNDVSFSIETFAKITKATAETYSLSPTVAKRMDEELFDNLIDFVRFMDQHPSTMLLGLNKVVTQLQTSSYYKCELRVK